MEDDYDFCKSSQLKTALIVDFMSNVRTIDTAQCQIFKDILLTLCYGVYNFLCTFHSLDIIYDSYIGHSIKFSEGKRWAITLWIQFGTGQNKCIYIHMSISYHLN